MATAKELDLREGDVVRLGMPRYELVPSTHSQGGYGQDGKGLDMTRGARVRVLRTNIGYENCLGLYTKVVYLDDVVSMVKKDKRTFEEVGEKIGKIGFIWEGYVGFIPESLERKESTVPISKN